LRRKCLTMMWTFERFITGEEDPTNNVTSASSKSTASSVNAGSRTVKGDNLLGSAGKFKPKEKQKWKYLQKYYHKGVFYMDEDSVQKDDVRARDFSEATLEDKFDRASLPAVLQVKKFGMRGRTKYTHLLDQDTTRDKNTLRPDQNIMKSYVEKRAGVHGDLETAGRVTKKSKHN
jgi:hypothetical protein